MAENHRDLYYTRRNGMDRPASTGMYYSSAWESKLHELVVSSVLSFSGFLLTVSTIFDAVHHLCLNSCDCSPT